MQFITGEALKTVTVEHNGRSVLFDIHYLTTSKNQENIYGRTDPYLEFNKFVKTKPLEWQDKVFNHIVDLRDILDGVQVVTIMFDMLNKELIELYKLIDMEELRNWVVYKSGVNIPIELKNDMNAMEDRSKVTESRTYFRGDYIDLITYSLSLRLVALVLGEYINRSDKEVGTVYRDSEAYRLLYRTSVFEHVAVDRLRTYISANIDTDRSGKDRSLDAAVISSTSRDDYPEYLLGSIVTKKISLGDISGLNPKLNIIKVIFRTENQKNQQIEKNFLGGRVFVKPRPRDKAHINENNSQSVLEAYKARQSVSDDIPIFMSVALENPTKLLHDIDPTVPPELLEMLLDRLRVLHNKDIEEVQLILAKYIINKVIPNHIIPYLEMGDLIKVIAIGTAVLWNKGFYEFAIVLSGTKVDANNEEMFLIPTIKKEKLKPEMRDILKELYPYSSSARNKNQKTNMSIISSLDSLDEKIRQNIWRTNLPRDMIKDSGVTMHKDYFGAQGNNCNRIAEMFIWLANIVPDTCEGI